MAEYIEREALLDSICHETCGIAFCGATNCAFMAKVCSATAADVAPVVRCKDCRYWQDNNGGYPNKKCRWREDETPDADDFCSYGERKEDENETGN